MYSQLVGKNIGESLNLEKMPNDILFKRLLVWGQMEDICYTLFPHAANLNFRLLRISFLPNLIIRIF